MNKVPEFRIMTDEEQAANDEAYEAMGGDMALYGYDTANPPKHTGIFYRGYSKIYSIGPELHQKSGYRKLKRKSCKGCPTCDYIDEEMALDASNTLDIGSVKDGALYELKLVGGGQCPISGEWEGPELVFEEVKEEGK